MTAGVPVPARRRAGEMDARPFTELLALPQRRIRGGPHHAAIGIGQLDEELSHHDSSQSNRLRAYADNINVGAKHEEPQSIRAVSMLTRSAAR